MRVLFNFLLSARADHRPIPRGSLYVVISCDVLDPIESVAVPPGWYSNSVVCILLEVANLALPNCCWKIR